MDAPTKETFVTYAKKCKWLYAGEVPTPEGRRHTYVTPAGNFVFAIYDIGGELMMLAMPAPQQPAGSQLSRSILGPH